MNSVRSNSQEKVKFVRWGFRILMIFGFLFNINLIPHVSTSNVCSLIAIIYLLFHKNAASRAMYLLKRSLNYFYIALGLCVLICIVNNALYSNSIGIIDELRLERLIPVVIQVLAFSVFCLVEFHKFEDFAKVMICVFCVQTVVVILSVINSDVRLYLYEHFYFGDDRFEYTVMQGTRFMGIALNSASGSVVCSTVIAVLCGLKIRNGIEDWLFWTLSSLFMLMTFFIARTGVLMEIGMIASVLIFGKMRMKSLAYAGLLVVVILFSINYILSQMDSTIAEHIWTWMTDPYSEEGREHTLSGIAKHVPSFSKELVFGTNIMRGRLPFGDYVQSDSGFIKMYCSLGIVGSFLYYSAFFAILMDGVTRFPKKVKYYFYVLILLAFIIEYKEPFFLMGSYTWAVLTIKMFFKRDYLVENNHYSVANKEIL